MRIGAMAKSVKNSCRHARKTSFDVQRNELKMKDNNNKEQVFAMRLEMGKLLHDINKDIKKVNLKVARHGTPNVPKCEDINNPHPSQAGMDYYGKFYQFIV